MYGCEIVWSWPIGSAASAYARRPLLAGDEELPRHAFHRSEHALVDDVPCAQLVVDHAEPLDGEILLSRHG